MTDSGMFNQIPYSLDWGTATPEAYNTQQNEALHIFNCDLSTDTKMNRAAVFIIGRSIWFNLHLPDGCRQKFVFDIRGQNLSDERIENFRSALNAGFTIYIKDYLIEFKK